MVRVKYKYSDGFQIQKTLTVKKDMEIGDFLELARISFLKEYPQLLEIKGRIGLFFVVGKSCYYVCGCIYCSYRYMYMCMCEYVYMCIYVYICVYVCLYVYICVCVHMCMCTYVYVYMYMYLFGVSALVNGRKLHNSLERVVSGHRDEQH